MEKVVEEIGESYRRREEGGGGGGGGGGWVVWQGANER